MTAILSNKWLNLALRWALGFVFIYAAIEKIAQPELFARDIANYRLLPLLAVNIVAISLPWVELLVGLALIADVRRRGAALLIGAMLIVFIVAITAALARGLDISCGCFGTATASKVGWTRLVEDFAMLFAAIALYYFPRSSTDAS